MLKVIFGLLITVFICSLIGVGLGFYFIYLSLGFVYMIIFLGVFITLIIALVSCIISFVNTLQIEIDKFIKALKAYVKSLSLKDILKIIKKLTK